jgi:hypothetical protein
LVSRRRGSVLGVAVALVILVACSGGGAGDLPKVPDFKLAATTTTDIDYSEVGLKGVPGKSPTTSVVFGPGQASLSGAVISDEGAIPGATILVERIVSGSVATMLLQTAEDGTWSLPQVLGGRYRLRAWRPPDFAQTTPSAVFLGSTETKSLQLRVRRLGGLSVKSSIAPDPPRLGSDANLVVLVTLKQVDDQGIVRATPQTNIRVDLIGSGGWRVESENPTATDDDGRAFWTLRCRGTGRQPLAVTVGTETIPLDVSSCVDPTEESTTTTSEIGLVP